MTIKINATKLGIEKPIEVKSSLKLKTKATKMMAYMNEIRIKGIRTQIKAEKEPKETDTNSLESQLKQAEAQQADVDLNSEALDKMLSFIQDVLKLSDKQMEKAEETLTDEQELGQYISYIVARLNGVSDKQYELSIKQESEVQADEDLKKD